MLIAGYDSEIELTYTGLSEIPADAIFVASVAANVVDAPLGTLRSADGEIVRVSSTLSSPNWVTLFRIKFAGSLTEAWGGKTVFIDMARTDVDPDKHMGFTLRATFHAPITKRSALA